VNQEATRPAKKRHGCLYGILGAAGAIIVIIIAAIATAGGKPGTQVSATSTRTPAASSAVASPAAAPSSAMASPSPSGPVMLSVGDTAHFTQTSDQGNTAQASVTVTSVKATTQPGNPQFGESPQNGYYVIASVTVSTSGTFDTNPLDFYTLVNSAHYDEGNGNADFAVSDPSSELQAATLNAGEHTTGLLLFDVPGPHGEIVYAPNYDSAPLAEWKY
jgi:cytoskeletal protein RodZ